VLLALVARAQQVGGGRLLLVRVHGSKVVLVRIVLFVVATSASASAAELVGVVDGRVVAVGLVLAGETVAQTGAQVASVRLVHLAVVLVHHCGQFARLLAGQTELLLHVARDGLVAGQLLRMMQVLLLLLLLLLLQVSTQPVASHQRIEAHDEAARVDQLAGS